MKIISKLAILIAITAFISSCQKEKLPTPIGGSSLQNVSNQRMSNSTDTTQTPPPIIKGDENTGIGEIVGGGDDDRDGGDSGKKVKKNE